MVRRAKRARLDMREMMTVMEYAGETAKEEVEEGRCGMCTLGLEDVIGGKAARKQQCLLLILETFRVCFWAEALTATV